MSRPKSHVPKRSRLACAAIGRILTGRRGADAAGPKGKPKGEPHGR